MCDLKYVIPHKYVFAPPVVTTEGGALGAFTFRDKTISPAHSEMCSALLASYYLTIRVLHLGRDLLDSESALHGSFYSLPSFDFCAADTRKCFLLVISLEKNVPVSFAFSCIVVYSDLKPSNFHSVPAGKLLLRCHLKTPEEIHIFPVLSK